MRRPSLPSAGNDEAAYSGSRALDVTRPDPHAGRSAAVRSHPRPGGLVPRGDGRLPRSHRRRNPALNAIVSLPRRRRAARRGRRVRRRARRRRAAAGCTACRRRSRTSSPTAGMPHDVRLAAAASTSCPTRDSLMVERMKAAGCIVIGKTNMPEFGLGSHTFNDVFGATRNAYDTDTHRRRQQRRRGGRAGDADAAGRRRQRLHGSLRNPAAWNNVFGFRPSQGRVPSVPGARRLPRAARHRRPDGAQRARRRAAARHAGRRGPRARRSLSAAGSTSWRPSVGTGDARRRPMLAGCASAGSATSAATCAMEPGILDVCARGLARLESLGARRRADDARRRPRARCGRRGWCGGTCSSSARPRPLVADPAQPGADQARGAVGDRPRPRAHRRRRSPAASEARTPFTHAMLRCSSASTCWRCRPRRCGRSPRASAGRSGSAVGDGHIPPLDGGRRSTPRSPGCRRSACRSASTHAGCRWACS